MNQERLNINDFYQCADLACVTAISLWFPIEAIDRTNLNKAVFLFRKQKELDQLLEQYWRGEIRVEPQTYFNQLRSIKSRLYESNGGNGERR